MPRSVAGRWIFQFEAPKPPFSERRSREGVPCRPIPWAATSSEPQPGSRALRVLRHAAELLKHCVLPAEVIKVEVGVVVAVPPPMSDGLHSHRIGGVGGLDYLIGAGAHLLVWGGLQLGALSPVLTLCLWRLDWRAGLCFLALALFTVLCPAGHSKHFCRFYLKAASTVGGATAWVPEEIMQLLETRGYLPLSVDSMFFCSRTGDSVPCPMSIASSGCASTRTACYPWDLVSTRPLVSTMI